MEDNSQILKQNVNITNLYKLNTEYNADAVEWCPHESFQNYFVCANYELNEKNCAGAKRFGRLLLYSVSVENGLKMHQTIETDGILDIKWCHNQINEHSTLAVATSNKKVIVYKLNPQVIHLEFLTQIDLIVSDSDLLILSLDWSTGLFSSQTPDIVCSDSKGDIHRLKLENNQLKLVASWNSHGYEAWISAFYYWDPNIVFSGGDDALLKKYDQRSGPISIATNKTAEAGVTSIHSNKQKEHMLVTGSYDSYIRLWDDRALKTPLYDIKMPGPVWRLKWDPFEFDEIFAACMLEGVHIVESNTNSFNIKASYFDHKNIAYGIDWSHLPKEELEKLNLNCDRVISSCSFYDRLLCVSKYVK